MATTSRGTPNEKPTTAEVRGAPLPQYLLIAGILVGLVLVIAGLALLVSRAGNTSVAVLSVCVGFGIVLVVFGTQAGGKWSSFWATGAGALAVGLYVLMHTMPFVEIPAYARGKIEDSAPYRDVRIVGSQNVLVGRAGAQDHQFVAFHDDLTDQHTYILASELPEGPGSQEFPREFYIGCIPTSLFRAHLGKVQPLSLGLQWDGKRFSLVNMTDGATYGEWAKKKSCPGGEGKVAAGDFWQDVFKAIGQAIGVNVAQAQEPISAVAVAKWLLELESADPMVRDAARDKISTIADPATIKLISGAWNVQESTYRADLGRLVSWTEATSSGVLPTGPLIASLSSEQLTYTVGLVGYPDSTMQGWATELATGLLTGSNEAQQKAVLEQMLVLLGDDTGAAWHSTTKPLDKADFTVNVLAALAMAKCQLSPANFEVMAAGLEALPGGTEEGGSGVGPLATGLKERTGC